MTPSLNTRARLARAARNNVPLQTATETFRKFKWFTLVLIFLFPLYPSLSLIGSDASAHGADYDESSIITAYSDDSLGDASYFSENWLIALGQATQTETNNLPILTETTEGDTLTTPAKAEKKRAPQIVRYTVKQGDTLAKISSAYNVSIDAIRWANDISLDTLKPGMIIKVPPTSGVVHIVKKWDTISGIAARYDIASIDIVSFNQLWDKMTLRIWQELMIPWAQKSITIAKTTTTQTKATTTPVPQTKPTTKPVVIDNATGLKSSYAIVYTGKNRGFVPGNCTAYVAQNKSVTWRGNANAWIRNARAQWIPTGSKPIPGAIVQFSGRGYSRAYGHVGIVADVQGDYIIVKDMNYRGLYEVTIRKVKKDDPAIDGYIYVD